MYIIGCFDLDWMARKEDEIELLINIKRRLEIMNLCVLLLRLWGFNDVIALITGRLTLTFGTFETLTKNRVVV